MTIADADLRPYGWAPGNYLCKCRCGEVFTGDKRCRQCRTCAEFDQLVQNTLPPKPALSEQDEIALLKADCIRLEWAGAEAMALVISHECEIERLRTRAKAFQAALILCRDAPQSKWKVAKDAVRAVLDEHG